MIGIGLIVLAVLLGGATFVLNRELNRKPKRPSDPAQTSKSAPQTNKKRERRAPLKEVTEDWVIYSFAPDPTKQMPDWAALPHMPAFNVAGTSYQKPACEMFFEHMKTDTARATIKYEDDRDPPGLMVYAHPTDTGTALFVGYVPTRIAEKVRNTFRQDMPIGARLVHAGFHRSEDAHFFEITLVGPRKKIRDTFLLQGQKSEE